MKQFLVLLAAALLMLSVCCSCSSANRQAAETAAETASQPAAEETSAPEDETLYFQLSDLPKIGSYYSGTVCKRMTQERVEVFQPSDQYGAIMPYIGDYRTYTYEEYDGTVYDDACSRYGLMTTDGTVITDAVYDSAYTDSGLIILSKRTMNRDSYEVEARTILPVSGKWKIDIDHFNGGEGSGIFCSAENDRFYVCDGSTVSGYDFSGKKLFTVQKNDIWNELIAENGCFLITDSTTDGKDVVTLLDKNGKELWSLEARYHSYGDDGRKYFPCALMQGEESSSAFCGVVDLNGEWVVSPDYCNVRVFGDKYFACDNGYEQVILDEKQEEVTRFVGSGSDAPYLHWFNDELLYSEYNHETENIMYYTAFGDEPIAVKDKTMAASQPIDNTKLYFGIDTDGVGYFFTRDGTVKKTFSHAVGCDWGLRDDLFTVITASDQKRVAHVIDVNTLTEKFSYTRLNKGDKEETRRESITADSTARHFLAYQDCAWNNDDGWKFLPCQIINTATGKTVVKDCDEADVFVVNGKEYCCFVKDNTAVVMNEDENVLLRIPASDLD